MGTTNNPAFNIGGNFDINGTITVGTGLQTVTGNLNVNAGGSLSITRSGAAPFPAVSGTVTLATTGTVGFTTGAQTIPDYDYGNLTLQGGAKTLASTSLFTIKGNLTVDTTAGLVDFSNVVGTVELKGNISGTFSDANWNSGASTTWDFNGTSAQTIGGTVWWDGNILISNTVGVTQTIALALPNIGGNFTIAAGAIFALGNAAGTTPIFPPVGGAVSFDPTSTFNYQGNLAQTVATVDGATTIEYGNLGILYPASSGVKTVGAGGTALKVKGNLTITDVLDNTTNNIPIEVGGNFNNSGTFTNSASAAITFNSTTGNQTFTNTGTITLNNVTMNNTATAPNGTLTLANDLTIPTTKTLTFTKGNIVTGANKVIIPSGATVSGAASGTGWVAGNLQKHVAAGTQSFEVGTNGAASPALAYSPMSLASVTVGTAGGLIVSVIDSTTSGDHPNIGTAGLNTSKMVNRYWNATTTGVSGTAVAVTSYSATFNFLAGDVDAGATTSSFIIKKYSGGWTAPTVSGPNATDITLTGGTSFSDFLVGEVTAVVATCTAVTGTPVWNLAGNWDCAHVPAASDIVIIPSGSTVTLDVNTNAIESLTINAGGALVGDNAAKVLLIDGTGTNDFVNNGSIDFSGSTKATLRSSTAALDISQTGGTPTWKFSTIDFNSLGATLSGITAIEFNGHATPFQNTTANITGTLTATWTFSGSTAQTVSSANITRLTTWTAGTTSFSVTNTNVAGLTIAAAASITGNLSVGTNAVLELQDTFAATGTFGLGAGGLLYLTGGTTPFPSSSLATLNATSTVHYASTVYSAIEATTYGHLIVSNAGTAETTIGDIIVQGNFTLQNSVNFVGLTNGGADTVQIAGNFVNNSATFASGDGTWIFNGTAAQTLSGSALTFESLQLNNTAGTAANQKLTLSTDVTVNSTLTLTSGRIVTGTNKLVTVNTTSVSRTSGWVAGNFQKYVTTGGVTFEVGTDGAASPALAYTPVSLASVTVTTSGGLLVKAIDSTTSGDHPDISNAGLDTGKMVNRYFTLTTTGVSGTAVAVTSYSATLNFLAGDVDGGATTANFIVKKYSGAVWTAPSVSSANPTSIVFTGTSFSDFLIGESASVTTCVAITGTNGWNTAGTWTQLGSCNRVPIAGDTVTVPSGATVTLDVNTAAVASVTINAGGTLNGDNTAKVLLIDGTGTNDLVNNGTINLSAGTDGVLKTSTAALDISQTGGSPTWKFSTIDFNSLGATLSGITAIEMNGHATPFQNTSTGITGALTATWTFAGTTAQTISTANITNMTTWTTGTANFTVSNSNATGLTIAGAATISGDLSIPASGYLTLQGLFTVSGADTTVAAGGTLDLAGTTTAMVSSTNKTFNATSTVKYSGTGAQTVTAETYGHLVLATSGNKSPTGTVNIEGNLTVSGSAAYAGNTNNPTVNLKGNLSTAAGTFDLGTAGTAFTFNGTSAQAVTGQLLFTNTGTTTINNTTATGVSLASTGQTTFAGPLTVPASGVLTLLADTTNAFPGGAGAKTFNATSTVRYAGNGNQTVSAQTYGHLYLIDGDATGNNTKTPAASAHTIAGNFTLAAATVWSGSTNTMNFAGNFTNSGTFTSGSGVHTFNGTSAQTMTGATSITNLTMNNSAAGANKTLTIAADLTIAGTLTFTAGRIVTGANKVIISSGGAISGAAAGTGWVAGNLQKHVSAGAQTFEVGTNGASSPTLAYTQVDLTSVTVSVAGGLIVSAIDSATSGDHANLGTSGINNTKMLNRYWTMTTTGVSGTAVTVTNYDSTFNFVAGDVDGGANTANFVVKKYSGGWTQPTLGTAGSTSISITGQSAFSDFVVGELSVALCIAIAGTNNWGTAGTWTGSCNRVPIAGDSVSIPSGATVTLNVNTTAVEDVDIDSGGTLNGDGTGKILLIDGTGTLDLVNDGTIDLSAANAGVLKTSTAALDISQTGGSPTWKFSTIDFNSLGATLTGITGIEMNGHATPFQNTTTGITGALTATWTFAGSTAQTISSANITNMTTWTTGTANFTVSNTNAAGLSVGNIATITGDLVVSTNGVLTLLDAFTVSGGDTTVNAGAYLYLSGTAPMVTSTNKTFNATSNVVYTGNTAQTVSAETYGNLSITGGIVGGHLKTPAAGTITVVGTFALAWDPLESTCRHASLSIL